MRRNVALRRVSILACMSLVVIGCVQAGGTPTSAQSTVARGTTSSDSATSVAALLSKGATLQKASTGDVDGDGVAEIVAAVGTGADDHAPRALLIARRVGERWTKAALGAEAVQCQACGGAFGDPLKSITPQGQGFELRFEGGSRELWSVVYGFVYDASEGTWVLSSATRSVLDRLNGQSRTARASREDFGHITIELFDASDESIAPLAAVE